VALLEWVRCMPSSKNWVIVTRCEEVQVESPFAGLEFGIERFDFLARMSWLRFSIKIRVNNNNLNFPQNKSSNNSSL
jgi:hypothetical protein